MASLYPPSMVHQPEPHPYLHEPRIYITNLPAWVTDAQLALAFVNCSPFRPNIPRDATDNPQNGTVEFRFLDKAEKALATLNGRYVPEVKPPVSLVLSPYPPTSPPTPLPPPNAQPRLVKHLPPYFTDSQLYDLFRPYGSLASVRTQAIGRDNGIVEFWREEDAKAAEAALHCADVDGSNIAIQLYQPRRASGLATEFNATAPTFVPSGQVFGYPQPQYSPSPPRGSPYMRSAPLFMPGPGQQVQPAAPGTSHSGLIDPCNLFCKNLDPDIDSNTLFSHFRHYGQIVSARVMRNETGESRGFGFVSYQAPDQAMAAMAAMNGVVLGTKPIIVRLHEPKNLRQEKLAMRFQGNGHPRSASGATSPTHSEGESFGGWSPRRASSVLASSPSPRHEQLLADRGRRSSGSYYQAALSGNLNVPISYDELSSLSPVVRKEVLTGELNRRVKATGLVPTSDIDAIVGSLVSLRLSEVIQGIQDPARLSEQISTAQRTASGLAPNNGARAAIAPSPSPSPALSHDSRLLDASTLVATASAPEHPSTPISLTGSLATPPRTASPAGSLPPGAVERDRMTAAIARLEPTRTGELVELLMSLPKRERAVCLFNVEVLRAKLAEAKAILDADEEEEAPAPTPVVPVTPQAKRIAPASEQTPKTPELSSRAPSAAASPLPATPSTATSAASSESIQNLARLPAVDIIRLANSSEGASLPLKKPDPLVIKSTDEFVDSIKDKPIQAQKQALGDKLFRVVKAFGIKGAPKLTIALLDQEDLRALGHLMNSYPEVLKEKALLVQANKAAK